VAKARQKKRKPAPKVWRPKCPNCGGLRFTVLPAAVPELMYDFGPDGMDFKVTVEDHDEAPGDAVTCHDCGRAGLWRDFNED